MVELGFHSVAIWDKEVGRHSVFAFLSQCMSLAGGQRSRHIRAHIQCIHACPLSLCVSSSKHYQELKILCPVFSVIYVRGRIWGRGHWFKSLPSTQEWHENEWFLWRKLVMQTSLLTKNSIISGQGRFMNLYQIACLTCFPSLRGKNWRMIW
jgi:hypothetical protein